MSDKDLHKLVELQYQFVNDKQYKGWQERKAALEQAALDRGAEDGLKEFASWFGPKARDRRPSEQPEQPAPA